MQEFQLYKDIQARTGGEVYIGVVGPVRTGKSTFIRKFMELMVLPRQSGHELEMMRDELLPAGSGKPLPPLSQICPQKSGAGQPG